MEITQNTLDALDRLQIALGDLISSLKTRPEEAPAPKQETPLTLVDVRSVCTEMSRNGYTSVMKMLVEKHGANCLTNLDPKEYAPLLADVEAWKKAQEEEEKGQ